MHIHQEKQSLKCQKTISNPNKDRVVRLVNWFAEYFPAFKSSLIKDQEMKKTLSVWSDAIQDLSDEQIRRGCIWVKNSNAEFLPSIPRFRFKCFGLIDSNIAYEIARENIYCDKAIYNTVISIGQQRWKTIHEDKRKSLFIKLYGQTCEKIMNGENLILPINRPKVEEKPNTYKHVKKTAYGSEQAKKLKELAEKMAIKANMKADTRR